MQRRSWECWLASSDRALHPYASEVRVQQAWIFSGFFATAEVASLTVAIFFAFISSLPQFQYMKFRCMLKTTFTNRSLQQTTAGARLDGLLTTVDQIASHAGVFRGACIMGKDEFDIRAPLKMLVCEAKDQIRQTFFQIALHREIVCSAYARWC